MLDSDFTSIELNAFENELETLAGRRLHQLLNVNDRSLLMISGWKSKCVCVSQLRASRMVYNVFVAFHWEKSVFGIYQTDKPFSKSCIQMIKIDKVPWMARNGLLELQLSQEWIIPANWIKIHIVFANRIIFKRIVTFILFLWFSVF